MLGVFLNEPWLLEIEREQIWKLGAPAPDCGAGATTEPPDRMPRLGQERNELIVATGWTGAVSFQGLHRARKA